MKTAIKDLKWGDRITLDNGAVGTILGVNRFPIIDVANDVAYEVRFTDETGAECVTICGGKDMVENR